MPRLQPPSAHGAARAARPVAREPFGVTPRGEPVDAFVLTNARGIEVRFISYGGIIVAIRVPDRDGAFADVTLGHDALEDYLADDRYFGALIGRYANRIARGRFTLDGAMHALATNDGANHLHGGPGGFHDVLWQVEPFERAGASGGTLRYTSPDGEEGYPGALEVRVTYTLTDADELTVDYHAVSDAPTPVNLTQHAYFNLAGHDAGSVLDHELTVWASRFTPVDAVQIPTGELRAVQGTPFDFTVPRAVGTRIADEDEQLRHGHGYDHNFVLDRPAGANGAPTLAARLRDPRSGRVLEVHTTEPGLQLYSGNVLQGRPAGKGGCVYGRHAGIALETQHFPDSPNQPTFPSTILRPGAAYASRTVYRFAVDADGARA